MGGRSRITPAAAVAALAFLVAGCSSPGTPVTPPSPTGDGFTHSHSPDAPPSRSKPPVAKRLPNPFHSASLAGYLTGRQGVVTAALYDGRTKQTWVFNPGVKEYTAS